MQIDALVRNVTLSGVFVVGLMICALIVCLLVVVLSLTFRCWWTLGDFYCVSSQRVDQPHLQRTRRIIEDEEEEEEEELVNELFGRTEERCTSPPPSAAGRTPLWLLRVERNGQLHTVKMAAASGGRRYHPRHGVNGMV